MTGRHQPLRCPVCGAYRGDVRPVALVEANSGPGWTRYACRTCVPTCPLDEELAPLDRPR
ncbi:hypothetical protein [Streptomyces chumphonensis]|uniref:hypothetical protein n=1 Tax=Streptomyces chumphonensis TaxID=1214925 RepID=UPI003D72F104